MLDETKQESEPVDTTPEAVSDTPPLSVAPPKSPELVHAEAELARLRDEMLRRDWENAHLRNGLRYLAALTPTELADDPAHVSVYAFGLLKKVTR